MIGTTSESTYLELRDYVGIEINRELYNNLFIDIVKDYDIWIKQ